MYDENEYDLAGFAVGIAEKAHIISGSSIKENDVIIGLASSGVHSNGYSLVRQVIEPYALDESHGLSETLGEVVMRPTKIDTKQVAAVIDNVTNKGISHITRGRFYENFQRAMPGGLGVELDENAW